MCEIVQMAALANLNLLHMSVSKEGNIRLHYSREQAAEYKDKVKPQLLGSVPQIFM